MRATILAVSSLLLSFSVLCLGHGLNNTLLGLRASYEHFPSWVLGVMMSAYFLGFIVGTMVCSRLIRTVGQIRTFAVFASVASVISLLHVLIISEAAWIVLRLIYGVCIAGLYMVIESWLNALAAKEIRGQVFSIYMTLSFLSLSVGQLFVFLAQPSEFVLFAVVSILISLALVPITLSTKQPPNLRQDSEHFGFRRLLVISPLATLGCFSTGMTLGAFWGLGAVYYSQIGLTSRAVGLMVGTTFMGGLLFQWPLGYLSDRFDRRKVIAATLGVSVFVCALFVLLVDSMDAITLPLMGLALFFGGFSYTLYSLFITLANDFLEPQHVIKASGGLIVYHAIGAIFGPTLAALSMSAMGSNGLYVFIGLINLLVLLLAARQIYFGRDIPTETMDSFVSFPESSAPALEFDPRSRGETAVNQP